MSGNDKRHKLLREEHLTTANELWRKGYNQYQIARMLNVSQAQVSKDLAEVRKRYLSSQMASAQETIAIQLEHYRDIRRELWEAWERSKADSVETTEDEGTSGRAGVFQRSSKTTKSRLPDSAYVNAILKTLQMEAQLLGLGQSKQDDSGGKMDRTDWDSIERMLEGGARLDVIEGKIHSLPLTPTQQAITYNADDKSSKNGECSRNDTDDKGEPK